MGQSTLARRRSRWPWRAIWSAGAFPRLPPWRRTCRSTGIRSPKPGATFASRRATASCGCRCSASRGSGSMAPPSSRSSRTSPRKCSAATNMSRRCCWRFFPWASAWVRCCASGSRDAKSSSDWCPSAPSACRCSPSTCISRATGSKRMVSGAPAHWRIIADLVLIGLFGGFYIVPLYALIQERSEPAYRSRIIAANNILNAIFMVASAGIALGLLKLDLTIPQLFLITGLLNAAVALYIYLLVPEFLMRFLAWILIHTFYRVDKEGLEHIPAEGACVIVCNHVSFVDAVVIAACVRRPIRFVMDHRIFSVPLLNFIFRTMRAIPIAPAKEDLAMMDRAFEDAAKALKAGEIVCIFPEGKITDTGELNRFRPGLQRILTQAPVPIVPIALRGLWGSFFSRASGGKAMRRLRGIFSRIALVAGTPVAPALATPEYLQATVLALRGDRR